MFFSCAAKTNVGMTDAIDINKYTDNMLLDDTLAMLSAGLDI